MIKPIIRAFLIIGLLCGQALAQTASILPPAKTTFLDRNGNPLTSGSVTFYIPSTTTLKTTWQDASKNIANTNPVSLDAAGSALIYGEGAYRQIVKDRNGNTIWDQITTSYVPSTGTTTSGDKNFVGTILTWAGANPPTNYLFTYGQEVLRASYPDLYTTITSTQAVTCTLGSPTVANVSDTYSFYSGMKIESSCFTSGTTVVSKTTNTVTLSNNATASTTTTATFFFYGNGNGSTTFNIPDLRGRILVGRDNMGNSSAGVITSADNLGNKFGSSTVTLDVTNIPSHSHTYSGTTSSDGAHTHTLAFGTATTATSGAGVQGVAVGGTNNNVTSSNGAHTHTYSGTTSNTGTGTAFTITPPSISVNYIIKVTAD